MSTVTTAVGPIHVDDHGAPGAPVAVLWPSLFTDHRMWRHQVTALHDAGWRTVTLDPPGHGRSPGPGREFTMDECADAVLQILDDAGIDTPVVLLGDSWGGFVAFRVALRAPGRVRALVVFNTSAERGSRFQRLNATLLTKFLGVGALDPVTARLIVSSLIAKRTRKTQPQMGPELADDLLGWDRASLLRAVRSVLINRTAVLPQLARLQLPALIVSGAQDHTLPAVHSRRIAAELPGSRHVQVADAAHLVPLEAPAEANRLILEFLAQHATG